jgi:hypothetical protein
MRDGSKRRWGGPGAKKTAFRASFFLCAALFTGAKADAAATAATPDFSPNANTAWVPDRAAGDEFLPPESGPGPVTSDKEHPYVPNGQGQPTYRIADLTNPILKPWAIEQMRKENERVRAGKIPFTARERCWPGGVPAFNIYERDRPIYFVQTPKEIVLIEESNLEVRHIHMNVPHTRNPKPSWYGESVGRFEGDTLVVDTIGFNDKGFVDNYRTPHTSALHVVERFRMLDGGKTLEARITVEDAGAFNMPWSAIQRWRKRDDRTITEYICAEDTTNYLNFDFAPLPTADVPDF